MQDRIRKIYEVGKSSLDFLELHISLIEGHTALVTELSRVVDRIGVVLSDVETGDREAAAANLEKARLVDVVHREYLLPIAAIARGNSSLDPATARRFRAPNRNNDKAAYIGAAQAIMALADEHKAIFIQDRMQDSFVTDLGKTLDDYAAEATVVHNNRQLRVQSRAELRGLAKQVMTLIKRFDGVFRTLFRKEPHQFAAWMSARNVPYPRPKLLDSSRKDKSAA